MLTLFNFTRFLTKKNVKGLLNVLQKIACQVLILGKFISNFDFTMVKDDSGTNTKNMESQRTVYMIKHAYFELRRAYPAGGIWEKKITGNKYINKGV